VALDSTKSLSEVVSESLMLYANMKGTKFEISVFDPQIDAKLSTDQKHIVFRILQELTNNTIKYAEASQITIKMECKKGHCVIDYADNGKGFNVKKVKSGVGLESIQTRIESVNGVLHMTSKPGHGSHTNFTIPYLLGAAQEIDF
jgi:signal transduction histidine kinase